jgi:hypothetical protein
MEVEDGPASEDLPTIRVHSRGFAVDQLMRHGLFPWLWRPDLA